MGLFGFVKSAGNKILRRDDDHEEQQQQSSEAPPADSSVSAASEAPPAEAYSTPSYSPPAEAAPTSVFDLAAQAASSAATAAEAAPAGPTPGSMIGAGADRVYVSKDGDTLDGLAAFFYGDAAHRARILQENPSLPDNTHMLHDGVQLRIPEDAAPVVESAPAEEPPPSADALMQYVSDLGLAVDGLSISVSGDQVNVSGSTATQEEREKVILALGNTHGVASVNDEIAVQAPAPEATFYTVVEGDTLSAIAQQQYGDANAYMAIFEANQPMLTSPDLIYPGQVLRIPAR